MNPDLNSLVDATIRRDLDHALARLDQRLVQLMPEVAPTVRAWTCALAGGNDPAAYFRHPAAFPTLLLPRWLDRSTAGDCPAGLHEDLIYSSICGYYAIRLLDNVMDEGGRTETRLLPAAFVFESEFLAVYRRHLAGDAAFWDDFDREWARAAEASIRDATGEPLTLERFGEVAAGKVGAGRIPLLAVCRSKGLSGLPPDWARLFARLSAWHQFHNDLFDWSRDLEHGNETCFLSTARERGRDGESPAAWVIREGMSWGLDWLDTRLDEMDADAQAVRSADLAEYLRLRRQRLQRTREETAGGLAAAAALLALARS